MHVIAAFDRHAALVRQDPHALLATPLSVYHEITPDRDAPPRLGARARWEGLGRCWRTLGAYRAPSAYRHRARWERTQEKVLRKVDQWRGTLGHGPPGRARKSLLRKPIELIPKDDRGTFEYAMGWNGGRRSSSPAARFPGRRRSAPRSSLGQANRITDLGHSTLSEGEMVREYVARWKTGEGLQWRKDRFVPSVKPV